jgi:branched-chain amino acid transport system ATP-binding protein
MTVMEAPVLSAKDLAFGYQRRPVVEHLTFDVHPGELVCILGANGAGKTTTLLGLTGELAPLAGSLEYRGAPAARSLHRAARNGVSFVTEERSIFRSLTTRDNLRVGSVDEQEVLTLFPELVPKLAVRAGLLSGGEQQMLTLGRALARSPRLLLADELSLGLAPLVVDRLLRAVRDATRGGMAALIVEQHARKALPYADRVIVLSRGSIVLNTDAAGAMDALPEIERAYLGRPSGERESSEQEAGR